MTLRTVPPRGRRPLGPLAAAMLVIAAGLVVLAVWLWATAGDRVLSIDFAPAATSTTLVPIESVGLIAPACATVDPVAYPCAPQMVAVQS